MKFNILYYTFLAIIISYPCHSWVYKHEITTTANYLMDREDQEANSGTTTGDRTKIDIDLLYGFFANKILEPIIQVGYVSNNDTTTSFKTSYTKTNIGIGTIFNLILDKKDDVDDLSKVPLFIPYGGFLISKTTEDDSSGAETKSTGKAGDFITKFIIGTRIHIYPHIAWNTKMTFYYNQFSTEKTQGNTTEKGTLTQMSFDVAFMGLTLMF